MGNDIYDDWFWERMKSKYSDKIKSVRTNFLFLTTGTMVYNYDKFDSYIDALLDAVRSGEETLDDMISLIFPEEIDHPIVKEKILKLL